MLALITYLSLPATRNFDAHQSLRSQTTPVDFQAILELNEEVWRNLFMSQEIRSSDQRIEDSQQRRQDHLRNYARSQILAQRANGEPLRLAAPGTPESPETSLNRQSLNQQESGPLIAANVQQATTPLDIVLRLHQYNDHMRR